MIPTQEPLSRTVTCATRENAVHGTLPLTPSQSGREDDTDAGTSLANGGLCHTRKRRTRHHPLTPSQCGREDDTDAGTFLANGSQ